MSDSIKVAIKVRPLIKREKDDNLPVQWVVQGNSIFSTDPEMKKRGDGGFHFDHIFDMDATNSDVFDTVVKPIVDAGVNGFNGTVFAYGQTSSGKTYTMMGSIEEPGIIPLAIEYMFDAIANTDGREFLLRVSYLEIYNERVHDLLNKTKTDLKLHEDGTGQVVLNCKEEITNCPENVISIMKKGDKTRRTGETNMNERSSRSHTIFRITIESREAGADSDGAIQVSQLNLVDLAGSERARQTGATGERFKEGRHINMSLSTLGLVIMQLSESQDGQKHVNFRDSKLTRLLQSSLGGNAMTAILCAVTPAALDETQCTLSFASRAKSVKNKPQINEVMSDAALLKRYAKQLAKLNAELEKARNENRAAEVEEMESKLLEKERDNQLLEERIELLKTRIVSGVNTTNHNESFKSKSRRRRTWGGPGTFNQHLPVFHLNTGLPTIKEMSPEKAHRKSMIQSVDIVNQTFQTAFADFELELIESERAREAREEVSDSDDEPSITKRRQECRVKFMDDVHYLKANDDKWDVTPEKRNISVQTSSLEASPSTPKNVLRSCISDLTKDFAELREYTTLEKQILHQEKQCCTHQNELDSTTHQNYDVKQIKLQDIPELKEQLKTFDFEDADNIEHIITSLCNELKEAKEQKLAEEVSNKQAMKKITELEIQMNNITSERNEYEYISRESRAELKKKTVEFELKFMSVEAENQQIMQQLQDLENQIENITTKKNHLEEMNIQLIANLNEKSTELESTTLERTLLLEALEKIPNLLNPTGSVPSEESRYESINTELNKKSAELESKMTVAEAASNTVTEKISQLEKQFQNISSERDKFKHICDELRTELTKKIMELESKSNYVHVTENSNLENKIQELQDFIKNIEAENTDLRAQLSKQSLLSHSDMNQSDENTSLLFMNLEEDKMKLTAELGMKIQELEEIKNDVQSLKLDVETLQKTIFLLTTENTDMLTKLAAEKERSREAEVNLQKTIDELYERISKVTDEKINLQSDVNALNEQLEYVRSKTPEVYNNEEQLLAKYQAKIDKLKTENIELSATIAEKTVELENIKESKSLLYEHECIYKDKVAIFMEKMECLVSENSELSTDLMERIEENDALKQDNDALKKKLEVFLTNTLNLSNDGIEQLKSENNILKSEIAELTRKVTILSDENAKFSDNLLETMQDLDQSRNEKSCNNTLHLSTMCDNTATGTDSLEETLGEGNREAWAKNISVLQDKVKHLTRLNKKLSDLKLTSCSQCAHLKNLNESRRAMKLEAKILNHKLEDLQKKFTRKCADTEALKMKVDQDLNLTLGDTSLNSSFVDGMNVSYIEEKVQNLNTELQTLKDDHEKLYILYQEKCDEIEKLHGSTTTDVAIDNVDTARKKHFGKTGTRIEKIQSSIDQVKGDIDEMKKNSASFTSQLNKFQLEKASLMEEIIILKNINEELMQKMSDKEISVTAATEKVQILENELTNMSKEVEQLSAREKLVETEKITLEVELEGLKAEKENQDVLISGLHRTIDELNERLSSMKNELDSMTTQKNELASSTETIGSKYKDEMHRLRKRYEDLEKENSQRIATENRTASWAKQLEKDIENLQADLTKQEGLYNKLQGKVSELENLLQESNNEKQTLKQKLELLESELANSKDHREIDYGNKFGSISQNLEEYTKECEMKLQKINETLSEYVEENDNLKQELCKLRDIEGKFNKIKNENVPVLSEHKVSINNDKELNEDLNITRECIIKELKSLKDTVNDVDLINKSVSEIFTIFLQTLMSKEEEVIRTMRQHFERDKQKLEDAKRQSADAEKRTMVWAKELETEIEKLQADLTNREIMRDEQQDKISQLTHHLRESNFEREMLKDKIEALEADITNLQAEFDKQYKTDVRQEEVTSAVQKREREVQEALRNKEIELESKIKCEREMHEKRVEDLVCMIESYKTKNMELKSNIEGFEANEKQLKNIIEANSIELKKCNQNIHMLTVDLEQLTDAYNELNRDMEKRDARIEEITVLLKSKCDMLSEYKVKFETLMPDYELLREQVRDRKANIERYKEEIEALRMEREQQIVMIKDQLNSEEIKNAGLNKQLNELTNKNVAYVTELDDLKEKYGLLQEENAKLERKIRNSTSKIKAEAEMEELKDLNKRLQNNLEGASNRITELQDTKNQLLKQVIDLKGQYTLVTQENAEMKNTLSQYKSRQSGPCSSNDGDKYDALLQEKNRFALELEGKKLLLHQRDRELEELQAQLKGLIEKNKDLDNELDDYAAVIRDRDAENAILQDKLHSYLTENKAVIELEEQVKQLKEDNARLETQLDARNKSCIEIKTMENTKPQNEKLSKDVLHALRKENAELQAKLNELDNKSELKSNSSGSRPSSPAFEATRRRQSRNELYNQRRQLESVALDIETKETEDKCQSLRKKIRDLELQLISKNGKIATLEMQILSENFPYQRKCKELEERLLAFSNKNAKLSSEVRKLEKAMNDINAWDCDICRRWRVNRRDQACQTMPTTSIRFCSVNSGVVEDHVRIEKLEKERALMKDLCRSRSRRIKDLEERIKELEELQSHPVLRPIEPAQNKLNQQYFSVAHNDRHLDRDKNFKLAMKENVPASSLDNAQLTNHKRHIWSNNQ